MKQGDIVIINFPFTSFNNSKIRPAVIVSNTNFNKGKEVLILAISSKKGSQNFSVKISEKDLSFGKLKKTSYIRFQKVVSIEKKLVLKKIGTFKLDITKKIANKLQSFIKS